MANVTTELKVLVKAIGRNEIDKLSKSLGDLGKKAVEPVNQDLKASVAQLKTLSQQSTRTKNNVKGFSTAFKELANNLEIGSNEFKQATAEAARLDKQLEKMEGRRISRPSAGAGLRGGLAAVGAYVGLGEITQQSREVISSTLQRTTSEQRLRALTAGFDSFADVVDIASQAAERFNLSQTDAQQQLAQVYGRLRPLGLTLQEIESTFVGFNTAARLSGATASESAGAFLQLSQALGSGVLRGEEFNSVAEQAPLVLSAIANVMDEPVGALKDLAKEGKITSDIVLKALQDIETKGAARLAEALDTPAAKLQKFNARLEDLRVALGKLSLPAFISIVEDLTAILEKSTKKVELYSLGFEQLKLDIEALKDLMPPWGNATVKALRYIGTEANIVFRLFQGIDFLLRNAAERRQAALGPAPSEYDITQGADINMDAIRLASERADRLRLAKGLGSDDDDGDGGGAAAVDMSKRLADARIAALQETNVLKKAELEFEAKLIEIAEGKLLFEQRRVERITAVVELQKVRDRLDKQSFDENQKALIEQIKLEDKLGEEDARRVLAALKAQDKLNEKMTETEKLSKSIGQAIETGVAGAIEAAIFEAKSLNESLSNILRQVASLLIQFGTKSLFNALPFANGGVFAQNGVVPFARGGVVSKPTLFPFANGVGLMGEAGPEAIMPLRRGPSGRLGVEASGGVGSVVVNVDASGSAVQGDQPNAKALGSAIGAAVQAELIKQKRPGGLLS